MYVTTFYSYKGGVGRTMALVNVAALLAKAGKRVLVVDFDLEAPGLPSFARLNCASGSKGVVDYVEAYRQTLAAPDVADHIVQCHGDGGMIWLMPAGNNFAPGYTARLNAINWEELYERQSGYLMFEDLKQQWAAYEGGRGFDYVLIDSRTGHTDVGGICTRQLPDAVVVMFVPNNQNIDGLVPIIQGIRAEDANRLAPIQLHFCPSNVPDEFDEAEILQRQIREAEDKLGFGKKVDLEPEPVVIHHRAGLDLLDQPVMALTAPKSQMAREYSELATSIRAQNLADREGALATLKRLPELFEEARAADKSGILTKIVTRAKDIRREHPHDGEIAFSAAATFDLTGAVEEELDSLEASIAQGYMVPRARLVRAMSLLKLDRRTDALGDMLAVLGDPNATDFEFRPTAQLLRGLPSADYVPRALELLKLRTTRLAAKLALAPLLMTERTHLDAVADEMVRLATSDEVSPARRADPINVAELALIGAGRFDEALEIAAGHDPEARANEAEVFNAAMARWGQRGKAPYDLIGEDGGRILKLPDGETNLRQCKALIHAVRGDREDALAELAEAKERLLKGGPVFSCWTYLYRTDETMLDDIVEMEEAIRSGAEIVPPFVIR